MSGSISFFARGDSNSASNPALNVLNTNQFPVTEITFVATGGGNVVLNYNGGEPDPDTRVIIDGVEHGFTLEFSATLPNRNNLASVNGEDLRGETVVVITLHDYPSPGMSQRIFFLPDADPSAQTMGAFPNSAQQLGNINTTSDVLICFCAGTLILTPEGEVPVEELKVGDLVITRDGTEVPIRWIGRKRLSAGALHRNPKLRPVRIRRGTFGEGRPRRDLRVSPQHRVLLEGWAVEMLFGEDCMLAPAKQLVDGLGITVEPVEGPEDYFHIMLDRHEILLSEGLPTESFHPGEWTMRGLSEPTRRELLALFPELAATGGLPALAGPELRGPEARALLGYLARAA